MARNEMPRINELRNSLKNPNSLDTYFQDFENSILALPVKQKHFIHIEADLSGLDPVAWTYLKRKAAPLFERRDQKRGWQWAFDILNQAKAYNYLTQLGCSEVEFIPEPTERGKKTPDLQGRLGTTRVLCEVKTINRSDNEAIAREQSTVRDIQFRLPDEFFRKLTDTLANARMQMYSYCPDTYAKKIVYVVLNFDDNLHEYIDAYLEQLRLFLATVPLPGVEIVFDVKPKYYSASLDSLASQLFIWVGGPFLERFQGGRVPHPSRSR
jgi:hypothetical protein